MDAQQIAGLVSSLILAMVPFVPDFVSKFRNRNAPVRYLRLVVQRQEVLKALEDVRPEDKHIVNRLNALVQSLDDDIRIKPAATTDKGWSLFRYVAAFEGFLFLGSLSTPTAKLVVFGESWETGLSFLEGVFQYPAARVMLLLFYFVLALYATFRLSAYVSTFNRYAQAGILLLAFNVFFVAISVTISWTLHKLDPVIGFF